MSALPIYFLIWFYSFGATAPQSKAPAINCLDCHKTLISEKIMHPVAEGCDNCHESNGKEHPQQSVAGFKLTQSMPGMCYTCHENIQTIIQGSKVIHPGVKTKQSCTACHNPHSSPQEKLLLAEGKNLCLKCHNKIMEVDSIRTENMQQLLDKNQYVHGAIEGGGCIACHNPHGSNNQRMLIAAFPKGIYSESSPEKFALCFTCHDNQLITADTTHSATQFRNGNKNLHFVHINGKKGHSCKVCHNVHASSNPHLINNTVPFGKWQMPVNYKPSSTGGSCAPGCHAQKVYNNNL